MGKFDNVTLQNRFKKWCYNCLDVIGLGMSEYKLKYYNYGEGFF